ncbi:MULTISPECIES: thioredoxin domain-containing protein [Streptomyces]|uniref:Thioredoxin-like fold domain-containing protein n=2 Tax=Streptomyces TaxID=1883 RepID=A0A2U9PAE7_STRAS|nr:MULTISPECIES: thioredoxin domain-containing protein [Streptomyces]AWT46759.1 hypothetical protein DMT42_33720 [Streptomyces actuosus]MBM4824107.1 thioredoxin domain-containing protein [Streptomyces actuosus]GHF41678.1 hypothetical protein GCM10018783_07960 [Streptomyces griseosporeus]
MGRRGRWAALCAVGALLLTGCGPRGAHASAGYAGAEQLPERLGEDGVTIEVGDPQADMTVHLYEDPRCPYCEEFETVTGGGPALLGAMLDGRARTGYTMASFLDDRLGGSGSKKAVNALRAALEQGKFVEYHKVLYDNQPEESVDGFTDAVLLDLAAQVEGLRGPAFDTAVRTMKYRSFVTAAQQAYEAAKAPRGPGTPTAVINGRMIPMERNAVLFDGGAFARLLQEIYNKPSEWKRTPL